MQTMRIFGSRRHVLTRMIVTSALLGSTFLVGLATTASAAPPYHLVVTQEPSTTDASGAILAQVPQVSIEDSSNAVQNFTSSITATITTGGVSVTAPTASAVAGVATFTGLALNALAGSYTLTFTDATDSATGVSTAIAVTVGAAAKLALASPVVAGAVTGVALAPQPVVNVVDSGGNIVTGNTSTVTAAYSVGGSTLTNPTKAAVAGVATFVGFAITAPIDTSTGTLTFTDGSLTSVTSTSVSITGPASKLVVTTQPSVSGTSGTALTTQPVISVEDTAGQVVKGDTSTVTAAIVSPPAGSSVTSATKAAVAGVATFTGLALNALAGSYSLTFADGSLTTATTTSPVVLSLGAAAKLAIGTQPSVTTPAGAPLAQQPVVFIQDSGGNLESTNTSTVIATLTSGSGTLVHATATAVAGVATFSGLQLNVPAGVYTLTFSDGALTAVVSVSITVSAGAASQLVITAEPSATVANGAVLAQQPVVKLEDAGGNVITGNSSTVTATVTTNAGAITNNTAVISTTTGLATFVGLTLKELVGTYSITFSGPTLTSAVSSNVNVTTGIATQLVVTTQPSAVDASGAVLAQVPVVKVEDSAGNVVATDGSTVTAKITSGGVSVTAPTRAAVAGVATFTGLALNALVGPYTLTFTDGALTAAVSTSIAVSAGAASQLVVATHPSASAATGVVLAQQPVVKVEDSGGNVVTSVVTGTVIATIFTGSGGSLSGGTTANITAGVATFSGLILTGVPGTSYTLTYSGNRLSVNDANAIHVGLPQATLVVTSVKATYGRTFALHTSGGSGTGATTYVVANGTASGCSISGATLRSSSVGTCIVTATKTGDTTYASTTSVAATIKFAKLPLPHAVRVNFAVNSSTLSLAGRNAVLALVKKLTTHSTVLVTGYAKGNLKLARSRASVAAQFLVRRLHVRIQYRYVTNAATQSALLTTRAQ
jgi:trimeric autotransporter adhesin